MHLGHLVSSSFALALSFTLCADAGDKRRPPLLGPQREPPRELRRGDGALAEERRRQRQREEQGGVLAEGDGHAGVAGGADEAHAPRDGGYLNRRVGCRREGGRG